MSGPKMSIGSDSFVLPLVIDPAVLEKRDFALYLAVLHHGMACFSVNGVPASKETVTKTADHFSTYLLRQS